MNDTPAPSVEPALPRERRANDVFPTTAAWLPSRVNQGPEGVGQANSHIMAIYAHPLKVYFLGCTLRWVGEPEDVINGFFADRLPKPDFLPRWLASGRPLRYWLITGFKHFLMESARRVQRDRQMGTLDAEGSFEASTDDTRGFNREVALSIVREATRRAEQACNENGLDQHWKVFVAHHVHSKPYEQLGPELGLDRARCAVMARTAANRFKAELRALVAWDGANDEQVDREIRSLLEATGS